MCISTARILRAPAFLWLVILPSVGSGQQPTPQQLYTQGKGLVENNWGDVYEPSRDELLRGITQLEQAIDGGYTANGKAFKFVARGYQMLANRFIVNDSQRNAYLEKAKNAYRQQIAIAPTDPEPRMSLAMLLKVEGSSDAALAQYLEVLKNDPSHPLAHFFVGFFLLDKADKAGAVAHFQSAVSLLDPELLRDVGGQMVGALKKHGLTAEVNQLRAAIDSRLQSQ